MTLLRDQAKEEIESHSRELDEAKQQHAEAQQLLQVARDEIAALQGALQAAAAGSSEEVERTLEAARQAESTAQQMRLETQVVSQQADTEVASRSLWVQATRAMAVIYPLMPARLQETASLAGG